MKALIDLFLETRRTLRAHAVRFGLTSLGIVWGAFMLTYLTATMEGTLQHFVEEIEEVGPRIVWAFPGTVIKDRVGERGARAVELENDDIDRMRRLDSIEHAVANIGLWAQVVRAGGRTKLLTVFGVQPETASVRNFEAASGRFISPTDIEQVARVAFLGPVAALRLFGHTEVVGKTLQIESLSFRVIGVSSAKGEQLINMNGRDDRAVLIPYTTAQRWFRKNEIHEAILFSPRIRERSHASIRHVRQVIGLHHDFDPSLETALSFVNLQDILKVVHTLNFGVKFFLYVAGLVTLLVGAVGVMNIMLVVVGERTGEIGLRKAVGASNRAIFAQFIAESSAVAALSALFGAGLGIFFVKVTAALLPPDAPFSSPPIINWTSVALAVSTLIAVGITAGVIPAIRATRVAPAVSLRSR